MCLYIRKLVATLSVLVLCSCSTVPLATPGGYTPGDAEAATQLSTTQSAPPSVSAEATEGSTEATQPYSMPGPSILTVTLHCTNYVETRWGTGPGEFGLCPASSEAVLRGPYPPVLNAQGDLFILDKVNQRILRYSGSMTPQIIAIPSSYLFRDVCSYSMRGWSNLGVSEDRLFLLFPAWRDGRVVDQLAVLSPEGREERIIDLEAYYPLYSRYAPIADEKGGAYVLLPPAGVVHFDADFRPEFKYLGGDESLIYENLVVGWDGNLYTYSAECDHLTNWGTGNRLFMLDESLNWKANVIATTQIVSPTYKRLLGVDVQGRLYFRVYERGTDPWFVRVSASGNQIVIAAVPEGEPSSFSLAPDGSLYGTTYNSKDPDPSLKPRIIRCVFDRDQPLTPTP